jgi:hypothetical protein
MDASTLKDGVVDIVPTAGVSRSIREITKFDDYT